MVSPSKNKKWLEDLNYKCECYLKLDTLVGEEEEEFPVEIPYLLAFNSYELLTIDDEVTEYPVIEEEELFIVFQKMAKVIPTLQNYDVNLLSFWMLDMFNEGLETAQKNGLTHFHQKAVLEWIAYFFNYIRSHNPSRKEMFKQLKKVLFLDTGIPFNGFLAGEDYAGEYINYDNESEEDTTSVESESKHWKLPLPPNVRRPSGESVLEIDVSNQLNLGEKGSKELTESYEKLALEIKENEILSNRNIRSAKIILEILYRIFGRLWVFLEIQAAFHNPPSVTQIQLPFELNVPKPLFKPEPPVITKPVGKLPVPEKQAVENENEKLLHKNDYILPLQVSEDSKLYVKQNIPQPSASDRSAHEKKGKK